TTYTYDNIGRQRSVTQTTSGSAPISRGTTTSYDDTLMLTTTTQDGSPSPSMSVTTVYDGVGRPRLVYDSAGNQARVAVRVGNTGTFGVSGFSYSLRSNPYVTGSETTAGWTVTTSDNMGRVTCTQQYSGSGLPPPWDLTASEYTGVTTPGC